MTTTQNLLLPNFSESPRTMPTPTSELVASLTFFDVGATVALSVTYTSTDAAFPAAHPQEQSS